MDQSRFYQPIVECLVQAPDHRATMLDVYAHAAESTSRSMGDAATEGETRWQHTVRNAMQFLKRKHVIQYLGQSMWGLGKADWVPWLEGRAPVPTDGSRGAAATERNPAAGNAEAAADAALLSMPIEDALIPTRLKHRLFKYGVRTVGDVPGVDDEGFARLWGVGRGTIADLHAFQAAIACGEIGIAAADVDEESGPAASPPVQEPLSLQSPVERLAVSVRLRNRLSDYGCATIGDMLRVPIDDFAQQRGIGKTSLDELRELRRWVRANVAEAERVPVEEEQTDRLRSEAKRALRAASQDPDAHLQAEGLATVASAAPVEGPIVSLADLLTEVIGRVARCRSDQHHQRDSAIWLGHYAVATSRPKTLDTLAQKHSLSKERVRQIIEATTRLAGPLLRADPRYAPHLHGVREAFASCLGVVRIREALPLIREAAGWEAPPTCEHLIAFGLLVEGTPDAFTYDKDTDLLRHTQACTWLWEGLSSRLEGALEAAGEGQHLLDFAYTLAQRIESCLRPDRDGQDLPIACCGARRDQVRLPDAYIRALVSTLDPCPLHGETIVSADWATLRFGRVRREVIGAALRVIGRPAHYSELAEFVRSHNRRWGSADDRTIHACLIGDADFVPTEARGAYGLREWGVERYVTVTDRVEEYLRGREQPATQAAIVAELTERGDSENAIRAAIYQNPKRFVQHPDGTVGLREWRDAGHRPPVAEHAMAGLFIEEAEEQFIMG